MIKKTSNRFFRTITHVSGLGPLLNTKMLVTNDGRLSLASYGGGVIHRQMQLIADQLTKRRTYMIGTPKVIILIEGKKLPAKP